MSSANQSNRPPIAQAATSFEGDAHDHGACVERALAQAAQLCARNGARLTDLRRRVLELIWTSHAPVGAYDLLERLSADQGRTAPPTVYRALDFLLAQGLIHRVESLNAFVGCADPGDDHAGQFLICTDCGNAAELHDPRIDKAITVSTADLGFRATRRTVEVLGLCPSCVTSAEDGQKKAGTDAR